MRRTELPDRIQIAFSIADPLPILQRLAQGGRGRTIRALILTPPRELAIQIDENLHAYGKNLPLTEAVIFGGVGQAPQVERLKNAALFMIGFLPRTLAAGAVLCIYWGVMLAWMPYTIPVVLILGFWLPCTLALQIIYPALDKAFHLEKTITARREDEINDLMEQHRHTSV